MTDIIVGIDYSLTCPCVCVSTSSSFLDCKFYFLHKSKNRQGQFIGNIFGEAHQTDYLCDQERHNNIAEWALGTFAQHNPLDVTVLIEDYSFGSKGKVFNLAENCGLLKHKLWTSHYKYATIAPGVIKKFATGKGNANKELMLCSFLGDTGVVLNSVFPSKKIDSPITDIVDSFYLARYMWHTLETQEMEKLNRGTNKLPT